MFKVGDKVIYTGWDLCCWSHGNTYTIHKVCNSGDSDVVFELVNEHGVDGWLNTNEIILAEQELHLPDWF